MAKLDRNGVLYILNIARRQNRRLKGRSGLSRRRDSMEKLLAIVLAVSMVAFCALIVIGCLVGIYTLIGFVL